MFKTTPLVKAIPTNQHPERGVHIDRIHITGPLNHVPLGELFYKAFDEYSTIPVGSEAIKPNTKKNPEDVYIRSKEVQSNGMANMLEIDCCPPKILQGHNFFGHADLMDYVYAIFCKQVEKFELVVDEDTREQWRAGQVAITEIHLTANYWCPEGMQLAIVDAIDKNNPKGKRRDEVTCVTLGLVGNGKRSKYHQATVYDKAVVLEKEWQKTGTYQKRILAVAKKSIRVEIKCLSQWLKNKNNDLGYAMRWKDTDLNAVFFKLLGSYQINNSIQRLITEEERRMLSRAELRAYMLWLNGENLNDHYGRTTVWKYAVSILHKTSIDVRAHRRPDALPALDLREVLVRDNIVPIPDWAYELPERYWQPGRSLVEDSKRSLDAPNEITVKAAAKPMGRKNKPTFDAELDGLAY